MSQKYGLIPDKLLNEHRMLSLSYKGGKLCYKNDIVLNRLKAHLGVFSVAPTDGVVSPDYTVLIPNTNKILPDFAETVLKSIRCRRELRIRVRGITEGFWRLYTDDFYTINLPVPSIEEQKNIMQYITKCKQAIKGDISNLQKEIELLGELKSSIISNVVTGKIDVRNIPIPEYERIDDSDADASDDAEREAEERGE